MKACHHRLKASWTKNTIFGVCTMRHGAGASSTLGTPCGRQLASGSSRQNLPAARSSYSALAHGWNGTGLLEIAREVAEVARGRAPDAGQVGRAVRLARRRGREIRLAVGRAGDRRWGDVGPLRRRRGGKERDERQSEQCFHAAPAKLLWAPIVAPKGALRGFGGFGALALGGRPRRPEQEFMKVDVVIVGARCAGAATALLLARAGARVVVVDRGRYGTDTLSTHALMRGAVLQLHRWGVLRPSWSRARQGHRHDLCLRPRRSHRADRAEGRRRCAVRAAPHPPRRPALRGGRRKRSRGRLRRDRRWRADRARRARARRDRQSPAEAARHRGRPGDRRRRVVLDDRAAPGRGADVTGTHAAATLYSYWSGVWEGAYRWVFRPGGSVGTIPTNEGDVRVRLDSGGPLP